jgi:hypothetical protein
MARNQVANFSNSSWGKRTLDGNTAFDPNFAASGPDPFSAVEVNKTDAD